MSKKYQNYIVGTDNDYGLYDVYWRAQTFTPSTAHYITEVKLFLFRVGTIGDITVGIRATTGGHPSGSDLTSGTYDGTLLASGADGDWATSAAWVTITLTPYQLTASTKYAIVVSIVGGDVNNELRYGVDESTPTYTDGNLEHSSNSGAEDSWAALTTVDWMFEERGYGALYPTDAATARVSSITHRYDRGVYSMELGIGDVISDFGIPGVDTGAEKSYEPKKELPPPLVPDVPVTPPRIGTREWMEKVFRPSARGEPGPPAFGPTYAPKTHRGYMETLASKGGLTLAQAEAELRGLQAHPLFKEKFAGMTIEQYIWRHIVPKGWSGRL